uniref:GB1/RHD3-type G domain-containing protein n=1 Tax=Panagrellus redivivus TaxID=6233 RepID=A0A7E4ZT60_PANRE
MAEVQEKPTQLSDVAELDEMPSQPGPVKIVKPVEHDHTFILNKSVLESILLDPKYVDKKVAFVSVAGAFRKGKSFLLNFFLRYLNWREQGEPDADWITSQEKLEGFSWRGGAERDTNGMLIWSRPFVLKDRNGEDIVVLLMDTQGAFDSLSTVKDCATIFALSTMLSSVQIYNISHNIQEDDLQHLQLFTEYGKLALEQNAGKPFQNLLFMVRDWSYPYDAEYGFQGGQRILEKSLATNPTQHKELRQLREQIKTSFESIQCFLMPHPGLKVARDQYFRGELNEIEEDFQANLKVLIPSLLDSNNLVVKTVNGLPITCRELLQYFKSYVDIFQGENMPEPKTMLQATAEANNLAAVASAKALYTRNMEEICGGDAAYLNTETLQAEHNRCLNDAVQLFKKTRKMGGTEFSIVFLERLDEDINEQYKHFVKVNNGKNLFKSMRTPAVLVFLMIADYVFQEFFQFIGLDSVAGIFTSIFTLVAVALCLWAYARYSGNARDVAAFVDQAVNWLWENCLRQFLLPASQVGLQFAANAASKKRN